MEHYGQPEPPLYDLTALKNSDLKILFAHGGKDELADPQDTKALMEWMPTTTEFVYVPEYAHLDFCWALDANKRVYEPLLRMIKSVTTI